MAEQVVRSGCHGTLRHCPAEHKSQLRDELVLHEVTWAEEGKEGGDGWHPTVGTQQLLVGGSSWQGWELPPAHGYSVGEDDPVLAEEQSLPCLRSTWRCFGV